MATGTGVQPLHPSPQGGRRRSRRLSAAVAGEQEEEEEEKEEKQHGVAMEWYRYKDSLRADMEAADLIISHAGKELVIHCCCERRNPSRSTLPPCLIRPYSNRRPPLLVKSSQPLPISMQVRAR
jgi:hypothetical protein